MATPSKNGWFRVAAVLACVPLAMAAGPWAGFALGKLAMRYLHAPAWIVPIAVALGCASSIIEVLRLVRLAQAMDQSSRR